MKNIIKILLLLFFISSNIFSQRKDIRIDVGVFGNLPERVFNSENDYKNAGFGAHIMPKLNYSEKITFGINMEISAVTLNSSGCVIISRTVLSLSPSVFYYPTNSKIKPFVGSGIGLYNVFENEPIINFGVRPIIGISIYDVFNLSVEYNRIISNMDFGFDNYYIAMKGSFSIGIKMSN